MKIILDIETNNLIGESLDYSSFPYKLNDKAKLWVVSLYNITTKQTITACNNEITKEWLQKQLKDCTELIGHNLLKFDLLMLQLFGILEYTVGYLNQRDTIFGKECKIIDTLILSRLFYPDRFGGHSLEAWGKRVGQHKIDFRQICIDKGYIDKNAPKGAEFQMYSNEMKEYCIGDTLSNARIYEKLLEEKGTWDWDQAIKMENKLADKGIRRELFGFYFDKELAIKCVEDLNNKMQEKSLIVEPLLPPKPMNKGELAAVTLPKTQLNKEGIPSAALLRFLERTNSTLLDDTLTYKGKEFKLPYYLPLETHLIATIDDLDHVKMHLIDNHNWIPTQWSERDLTKDAKKISISYEKRIKALEKWFNETINGKYYQQRIELLGIPEEQIIEVLSEKLKEDFPVRIPTSPSIRVGVEKELCPNLITLGDKVSFAKDFSDYLTYKHRRNSIAGGETEDMDFDIEVPNTGFLSNYREQDGRIPTPAIELGGATNRYKHISVANISRVSSLYGKEMRSLFGCGKDFYQFAFDFSGLEAKIQGGYCYNYTDGVELSKMFLAEKPFDVHTLNSEKLGIPRTEAKSVFYASIYGAQANKIAKMLGISKDESKKILDDLWDAMPSLKELRDKITQYWESTGKKYVRGIDGRKIFIRSKHSLLNYLFQSAGIIAAKYVTVVIYEKMEKTGYCTDPFIDKPDFCSMIEYHDEIQSVINKDFIKCRKFNTEEEAKEFIKNWDNTKGQLSTIGHGKQYFVVLPNIVSNAVVDSINEITELLKLNVPLSCEWIVGNTWANCH